MRIRNLAVIATLLPALLLTGCGADTSADVAASSPGAKKASKHTAAERSGVQSSGGSDDPVVNAYYDYRAGLDRMMRSGGREVKHLEPLMTPAVYQAITSQARYFRTRKLRNTGPTKVLWAKRTLASSGVIISACYDTTLARTVNARGRGVIPTGSPTRWLDQMRVDQLGGRWVVNGGRTIPQDC